MIKHVKIIKIPSGLYTSDDIAKLDNKKSIEAHIIFSTTISLGLGCKPVYLTYGNLSLTLVYCEDVDLYESVDGDNPCTYLVKII
jgi:hypothetical protein